MNAPAIYSSKFRAYDFEPNMVDHVVLRTTIQSFGFFEMEEGMRRFIFATAAALTVLTAGSLLPSRAEAMTLSTPVGIRAAIEGTNLTEDVAYYCRRVWRCGPYGCGWRRFCGAGRGYYGGRRYYRGYRRW